MPPQVVFKSQSCLLEKGKWTYNTCFPGWITCCVMTEKQILLWPSYSRTLILRAAHVYRTYSSSQNYFSAKKWRDILDFVLPCIFLDWIPSQKTINCFKIAVFPISLNEGDKKCQNTATILQRYVSGSIFDPLIHISLLHQAFFISWHFYEVFSDLRRATSPHLLKLDLTTLRDTLWKSGLSIVSNTPERERLLGANSLMQQEESDLRAPQQQSL